MNEFNLRTKQDIEDFLTGCAFYGTGGGGDVKAGRVSLNNCLELGLELKVTDPDDVKDDDVFCTPVFIGSIAPKTPEVLAEMERNGFRMGEEKYHLEDILIAAVKKLEEYTGKKMAGVAVAEMGGSNTACCMAAGYKLGIRVYDGDPFGRAIPAYTNGIPHPNATLGLPCVHMDAWGNCGITLYAVNTPARERIVKKLSEASYGAFCEAANIRTGSQLKQILIPRTISKAYQVGKAINQANAEGGDPCLKAAEVSGGKYVGKGVVTGLQSRDVDGYYWGEHCIVGTDESEGKEFKVWFKNENHVLWCNGTPIATSPDLITLINLENGQPLLNTYLKDGVKVGIVIAPACEAYMAEDAIAAFNPRVFGFDFGYVPFDSVKI